MKLNFNFNSTLSWLETRAPPPLFFLHILLRLAKKDKMLILLLAFLNLPLEMENYCYIPLFFPGAQSSLHSTALSRSCNEGGAKWTVAKGGNKSNYYEGTEI